MKKIIRVLSMFLTIGAITTLSACGTNTDEQKPVEKTLTITSPSDNDTNVEKNPLITWETSEEKVDLVVAYDHTFVSAVVLKNNLTEKEFQITDELEYDTTYYVKVSSGDIEDTLEFKTGAETIVYKDFKFAAPFKNNMVVQRDKEVSVWGTGHIGSEYTLEFNNQTVKATADEDNKVEFTLKGMQANAVGQTMKVSGGPSDVLISNVVVGEVIVASGQSNMHWTVSQLQEDVTTSLNLANDGNIRLMSNYSNASDKPLDDFKSASWSVATSTSAKSFSAVGYLTAANLYEQLGKEVPVGVISASQGETNIMTWISEDQDLSKYEITVGASHANYNAMINPMRGLTIGSVIWYQGEENSKNFGSYEDLLNIFVKDWRTTFNDNDLDFFIVQLPEWGVLESNQWPFIREAQSNVAQNDENVHLVVTMDGGDYYDVHPTTKEYITSRISDLMMYEMFNGKKVEYTYWDNNDVVVKNNTLEVTFTSNVKADGVITGFEIAGSDFNYVEATATLQADGKTISLTSDKVSVPKYVKYNFSGACKGNLTNEYDLPVGPFRNESSVIIMLDNFSYETADEMIGNSNIAVGGYKWGANNVTGEVNDGMATLTATGASPKIEKILNGNYKFYESLSITYKTTSTFSITLSTGSAYGNVTLKGNGEWQTTHIPLTSFKGFENYVWSLSIGLSSGSILELDTLAVTNNKAEALVAPDYTVVDFNGFTTNEELFDAWIRPTSGTVNLVSGEEVGTMAVEMNTSTDGFVLVPVVASWNDYNTLVLRVKIDGKFDVKFPFGNYTFIEITGTGEWQTVEIDFNSVTGGVADDFKDVWFLPKDGATLVVDTIGLANK